MIRQAGVSYAGVSNDCLTDLSNTTSCSLNAANDDACDCYDAHGESISRFKGWSKNWPDNL